LDVSITEIARAIQRKELDPVDLTEELLNRIEKFDREIRAYVEINPHSIKEAKRSSFPVRNSSIRGIPFSVKDLIDTKGIVTAYGAKAFENHVPDRDAEVVSKIKLSGGFVLGKTNTHQFALGLETPPTKNPWDRQRIPGGSSGGSAAAIAADLALVALGTDTGGSIRIPAAMCGVTGLKPTFGKISTRGVFPTSPSMDHVGPLCRFASDLPLLLEAMGYRIKTRKMKGPLKVGIIKDILEDAERGVRATVRKCFNLLVSERFVEIDEIELPGFLEACSATETLDTYETFLVHRKRFEANPKQYNKTARGLIQAGLSVTKTDLERASKGRLRVNKEFAILMKKYPGDRVSNTSQNCAHAQRHQKLFFKRFSAAGQTSRDFRSPRIPCPLRSLWVCKWLTSRDTFCQLF